MLQLQENTGHKVTAPALQLAISWFEKWLKPSRELLPETPIRRRGAAKNSPLAKGATARDHGRVAVRGLSYKTGKPSVIKSDHHRKHSENLRDSLGKSPCWRHSMSSQIGYLGFSAEGWEQRNLPESLLGQELGIHFSVALG